MKKKPPETIYLQCFDDDGELLPLHGGDVTWCIDQKNANDAVYKLVTQNTEPSEDFDCGYYPDGTPVHKRIQE